MTQILLVRHGEAAKGPETDDPELTPQGHSQAQLLAQRFRHIPPLSLASSPKVRARQTAQPLAELWQCAVTIEPALSEIPSPEGLPLRERSNWVHSLLGITWETLDVQHQNWRGDIRNYLLSLDRDIVAFCHFMVINSVVAYIRGDNRIRQFDPDYTSVTELRLTANGLEIVELGKERSGQVL